MTFRILAFVVFLARFIETGPTVEFSNYSGGKGRLEIRCLSCVPLVPLATTRVEISAKAVDCPHVGRSLLVKSGVLMA
ncbi:MAG: hypothetical protein KAX57_07110 [Rhodoferax sp.]|jgi:hypothetical protein|nr:hypothetical protein [Rhodoferax sp.]